ncbi:hypothetical protein CDQ84_14770 [Clostridium thermosuccinogenes]|uniref:Uncharacterized protein n=1 Tax=Clostridium thermosuccinogenes TaxID=84032 RepID=A0A2K2F9V5_9CLOT|nr:hypothetical protein [Pseudoclostridium thermosuccinogenes]AUS95651.1 hypothetical protein CDO33_03880 [Pseudoclostridium thermosuccinogenes]PNT95528.1 hypothetical protein CDQ85_14700 [Pseudoclostridium thermosuccinogenes]PNT96639.1 hypothetical protein CDQ84_14770 [Pseudoclostridium thermosuccinogenes]
MKQDSGEMVKREDTQRFPCRNCGANMVFEPDTQSLFCPYCESRIDITKENDGIQEYDFFSAQDSMPGDWGREKRIIHCESCGADTVLDSTSMAEFCAFCGSSHIVRNEGQVGIPPESLVPFKISAKKAKECFSTWINKRFFAPRALKTSHYMNRLSGVYIPCWTYDANTYSTYTAEAGTYYYETVREWVVENGKRKQVTKQVRKIRWRHTSGIYSDEFDDVLVNASSKIDEGLMRKLEPFDLSALVRYKPEFLSGFLAEKYSIGLKEGWEKAKCHIDDCIRRGVIDKINADEVRNLHIRTKYDKIKFKHILLPVWISSYTYKNKVYRFLVNGQTGEVQGKSPVSPWKVAAVILLVLAVGAAVYFGYTYYKGI